MKGQIQDGHIGTNRFELKVLGGPDLVFTEISGIESETPVVDLPDRTQATGGEEAVGEFTAMLPMHHTVQILFMDVWLQEGRDPVTPTYKRVATLIHTNIENNKTVSYELIGLFVSKRATPDLDMASDGDLAKVEYTFKYDSVIRLP